MNTDSTDNITPLTTKQKSFLISQLKDYHRVICRQLDIYQQLLLLHIELIPKLVNDPSFETYLARWRALMDQLKR